MANRGRIQRKTWCMGPYAGVAYNLTLFPLQSPLQHIYHGHWATLCQSQPYNPMPESTLTPSQGLCPRMDFWFPTMTLSQSHDQSSLQ
jgi:hypothetical protein